MKLFQDMDENQYWMTIIFLIFLGIMWLITTVAYNINAEDRYISDLVKQGQDPIEVACLYKTGSSTLAAPCLLIAQAKARIIADEANLTAEEVTEILNSTTAK